MVCTKCNEIEITASGLNAAVDLFKVVFGNFFTAKILLLIVKV